jgi:hypothetical protein
MRIQEAQKHTDLDPEHCFEDISRTKNNWLDLHSVSIATLREMLARGPNIQNFYIAIFVVIFFVISQIHEQTYQLF